MRATKVKYVPAGVAAQYIPAFKIGDKRELLLVAAIRGRVNTTPRIQGSSQNREEIPVDCPSARLPRTSGLQRAQEINQVLLIPGAQIEEIVHHAIRLAALTGMEPDPLNQVPAPSLVQKESALTDTPQRCRTEFVQSRRALGNPVRQSRAHMMHE